MSKQIFIPIIVVLCLGGAIGFLEYEKKNPAERVDEISVEEQEKPSVLEEVSSELPPLEVEDVAELEISTEEEGSEGVLDSEATLTEEGTAVEEEAFVERGLEIPETYEVKKGDTLSQISEETLGSIRHLHLLMSYNPNVIPESLVIGSTLKLPKSEELSQANLEFSGSEKTLGAGDGYRVQRGDTIYSISRDQFGGVAKVKEIIDLNPSVEANRMRVGTKLALP